MDKKLTSNVLIIGATGLVGSELLQQCCKDVTIGEVHVLTRSEIKFSNRKLIIHKFDFEDFDSLSSIFSKIDIVFCCIGTTMKKAGSKEAFRRVDFEIPVTIAKIAKTSGVDRFIAISSVGADANTSNFYLKTKGEMEAEILKLNFLKVALLRPSFLTGKRNEFRIGEKIALFFMFLFQFLFFGRLAKYKPIEASVVANAMLKISSSATNTKVYESNEIQWIGN
jgi:uncharacterized protein YbjT (DUF2867 family)